MGAGAGAGARGVRGLGRAGARLTVGVRDSVKKGVIGISIFLRGGALGVVLGVLIEGTDTRAGVFFVFLVLAGFSYSSGISVMSSSSSLPRGT